MSIVSSFICTNSKNLGKFHALPIALRLLHPNIFEKKVKPYLQEINPFENIYPGYKLTQVPSLLNSKKKTHPIIL